ncbi:hypothetical protein [Streptomyces globosus]|uniref:hypothetical protein n=1 Tax=Streptomyces globosus TaxID=68209 RepID=UPI0031E176A2
MSHADTGSSLGVPASSVSADGKFFTPGPNTIVKRTAGLTASAPQLAETASPISPAPTGTEAYYKLKNVRYQGQTCGTNVIQQTSGQGKTTLVLSVEEGVAATVHKEIGIDLKYVSAGMGWDVTRSYTVRNETRFEVPDGKWGTIQAFPLFETYEGEAWSGAGGEFPTGKRVWAYKPVGVCFNQWAQ